MKTPKSRRASQEARPICFIKPGKNAFRVAKSYGFSSSSSCQGISFIVSILLSMAATAGGACKTTAGIRSAQTVSGFIDLCSECTFVLFFAL